MAGRTGCDSGRIDRARALRRDALSNPFAGKTNYPFVDLSVGKPMPTASKPPSTARVWPLI